ncbi:hypothetical protein PUNSTDRAFT_118875 [Punctularia strigosozonata HHB-11173 SS5]|uniref:uncharacterized protein n=1 Tax=Punctularia strigosozonata (strain HHB-11173) TaxID=741275 RepID=UPI0004417DAE|nr:uncharacterized protein PUNSTDRAFT_118875 [Punctularia strigosozonata HHB-11173 SS5]EIN11523.1 hypothetical protein PUNSTDRAFT_118875 [Punctularia strigosozonata HHB-11173 SS5]
MRSVGLVLLLTSLSRAARVYLSPAPVLPPALSASDASSVLSYQFGLEFLDQQPAHDQNGGQEILAALSGASRFVGQGQKNGLLLTLDEADAQAVIPSSLERTFVVEGLPDTSSADSLVQSYLRRAQHAYSHIFAYVAAPTQRVTRLLDPFSVSSTSAESFITELSSIVNFIESDDISSDKFGAFELNSLREIAKEHGSDSEQYKLAAEAARGSIQSALAKDDLNLAVIVYDRSSPAGSSIQRKRAVAAHKARQTQSPLPPSSSSAPVGSVSRCFDTADACGNATNSCSGHGQCLQTTSAGRACFVCACGQTKNEKGKVESWAGESCERKDISGPFALIAGTTIALLLMIIGSVSLLSSIGGQELPGTLTGGVAGSKRD